MKKIVVGVDGSAASDAALRWAYEEARHWDGQVVAIHAWSAYRGDLSVLAVDEHTLELAAKQALADALARTIESPPFGLDERIMQGDAATVLIDAAADADLLVLGTSRHGVVLRCLLGSVSTACVHRAPCPVVVVPG